MDTAKPCMTLIYSSTRIPRTVIRAMLDVWRPLLGFKIEGYQGVKFRVSGLRIQRPKP